MSGSSQSSGIVSHPFAVPFTINFVSFIDRLSISVAAEPSRSQG